MGYLETTFEAAGRLGGDVNKQLQPARDFRARADALNRQLDLARSAEESAYGELVEAIAEGTVPPGEAAKAAGTWIFDSQSSKTIVTAVSVCHTKAAAAARAAGPRIFEALQRRVDGIVAESVEQSVALPPGVVDERSALRARNGNRQALDTWERLRELVDEWTACHGLNRTMQLATWIPGPAHANDRVGAWTFQAYQVPHRLATIREPVAREKHLAAAVACGARPGLYPWGDAVARWERLDRRQRNYGAMEVIQTHNSMGNVIAEERSPETASEFVPAGAVS